MSTDLRSKFVRTELERNLKTDNRGVVRNEIETRLQKYEAEFERQKQAGLQPLAYYQVERLRRSLSVARQVVRATWNQLHATPR